MFDLVELTHDGFFLSFQPYSLDIRIGVFFSDGFFGKMEIDSRQFLTPPNIRNTRRLPAVQIPRHFTMYGPLHEIFVPS